MKSIAFFSLFICLSQSACAYTKGKVYKLTILHTNDHHGRFWPNKEGELGLAPRATLIQKLRGEDKFPPLDALMRAVDSYNGVVVIVSGEHEGGRKLDGLGGVAALLRYKLNEE